MGLLNFRSFYHGLVYNRVLGLVSVSFQNVRV